MSKKMAKIGGVLLVLMVIVAVLAPVLAPYDPYASVAAPYLAPSAKHLLGTNDAAHQRSAPIPDNSPTWSTHRKSETIAI